MIKETQAHDGAHKDFVIGEQERRENARLAFDGRIPAARHGRIKEKADQIRFETMIGHAEDERRSSRVPTYLRTCASVCTRTYGRSSVQSKTAREALGFTFETSWRGFHSLHPHVRSSLSSSPQRGFRGPVPRVYRTAGISPARYVRVDRVITRRS